MRGIPRQAAEQNLPIKGTQYHVADIADKDNACRWNPDMWGVDTTKPGAQAYYDSIADLYASWGVDFIKADDMGSHLYQPAEVKSLELAIRKTGRPIVLSISPGPAPISEVQFFQKYAQMWRISDDFWDDWKLLKQQFDYTRDWAIYAGFNNTWPDADMLPLGKLRVTAKEGGGSPTKFTADEQRTLMTLWCIFRSPLIFGGDLPSNDGSGNHQALAEGNLRAWIADIPNSSDHYLAVFNLGEATQSVNLAWSKLGVGAKTAEVRDLWSKTSLGRKNGVETQLRRHASLLYRISE